MNGKYSPEVTEAIDLIWKSYDKEKMAKGYELLSKASEAGDADAKCYLARCLMGEEYVWSGGGFPIDEDRASSLLKESVRGGSASGVLCAMRNSNLTPGLVKDMPFASLREAFDEIKWQADNGDAFCLYMVGNVMFWGDHLTIEGKEEAERFDSVEDYNGFAYPIAADYYERSFEAGLSAAFGNYRSIYESGLSDIDNERFEEYFGMLADNGDPLLCNDYGKYLEDEYGDENQAFEYYMKAVEKGDLKSAYNIGTCYGRGAGVEKNTDKAFDYYMIAAREGHPMAQFQIGNFYFEGRGNVKRDPAEAFRWLSAAYDNPECGEHTKWECAAEIGVLRQNGEGTYQNDVIAFGYLSQAEEHVDDLWDPIDIPVLIALGTAYAFGRGTETDIERGIGYLDRAIEYGSEKAETLKGKFKKSFFGLGKWTRK